MKFKVQHGFTLLEVLVASVILISSIAAISLSYRGALLSSLKADKSIQLSGIIPIIIAKVSQSIKNLDVGGTGLSGKGEEWGIRYEWNAELDIFKSPPKQLNLDEQDVTSYAPRYRLWQVSLVVSIDGTEKNYTFSELSWLNEAE